MKKLVLSVVLGTMALVGTAFADHPQDKWGLGASFGWGHLGMAPSFELKIPGIPIFWGVNLGIGSTGSGWNETSFFSLGLTGDYYIFDKLIPPAAEIGLGWYLGVGGWVDFASHTYKTKSEDGKEYSFWDLGFGIRAPVGLSWIPPKVSWLEVFLEVSANVGLGIYGGDRYNSKNEKDTGVYFPAWGWRGDLGFRFWI
jgi:hypothetical protein